MVRIKAATTSYITTITGNCALPHTTDINKPEMLLIDTTRSLFRQIHHERHNRKHWVGVTAVTCHSRGSRSSPNNHRLLQLNNNDGKLIRGNIVGPVCFVLNETSARLVCTCVLFFSLFTPTSSPPSLSSLDLFYSFSLSSTFKLRGRCLSQLIAIAFIRFSLIIIMIIKAATELTQWFSSRYVYFYTRTAVILHTRRYDSD